MVIGLLAYYHAFKVSLLETNETPALNNKGFVRWAALRTGLRHGVNQVFGWSCSLQAIMKQHAFKLHTGKLTKLCPRGQQRCSIILLYRLVWGVSTPMSVCIGFVESDCWRDLLLRGVLQGVVVLHAQ